MERGNIDIFGEGDRPIMLIGIVSSAIVTRLAAKLAVDESDDGRGDSNGCGEGESGDHFDSHGASSALASTSPPVASMILSSTGMRGNCLPAQSRDSDACVVPTSSANVVSV